ncbi:hypothetical protein GCM10008171_22990 [Methylopila jiangsuensis]|uniref:Uncharacterized protein n=1 Tax=Methylopila jiangsuensis TaxID=586230 RepID=A0A9W6JJK5_9HYPH|nr:hypothetical protein GCM10008171_22990 [Methylopila jiangsuensis]
MAWLNCPIQVFFYDAAHFLKLQRTQAAWISLEFSPDALRLSACAGAKARLHRSIPT